MQNSRRPQAILRWNVVLMSPWKSVKDFYYSRLGLFTQAHYSAESLNCGLPDNSLSMPCLLLGPGHNRARISDGIRKLTFVTRWQMLKGNMRLRASRRYPFLDLISDGPTSVAAVTQEFWCSELQQSSLERGWRRHAGEWRGMSACIQKELMTIALHAFHMENLFLVMYKGLRAADCVRGVELTR